MIDEYTIDAKKYVEHDGMICPVCGHTGIGYTYNYNHQDSLRNFTCYKCRSKWRDTFKLTGFTDVVRAQK